MKYEFNTPGIAEVNGAKVPARFGAFIDPHQDLKHVCEEIGVEMPAGAPREAWIPRQLLVAADSSEVFVVIAGNFIADGEKPPVIALQPGRVLRHPVRAACASGATV